VATSMSSGLCDSGGINMNAGASFEFGGTGFSGLTTASGLPDERKRYKRRTNPRDSVTTRQMRCIVGVAQLDGRAQCGGDNVTDCRVRALPNTNCGQRFSCG
jgi:hypothetical protein